MAAGGDDYGDDLGRRFANRYTDSRANNRSPPTREEYYRYLDDSQTHVCTRLAAQHYNRVHGVVLKELDPVDSHAFSCRWVNGRDHRLCFHLNFTADAGCHVLRGDRRRWPPTTGVELCHARWTIHLVHQYLLVLLRNSAPQGQRQL
ncbi:uncharacterized protein LOC119336298 [Triticum dicoccoides]|uniref:uncharacterized protein LOC119336298 n=1 Tax=Triticum dicoccoides TaxID=85692 RepID=UPI00189187DE|nr:uncharacterized protein LOC119336298 [Triticum dicoccoides]